MILCSSHFLRGKIFILLLTCLLIATFMLSALSAIQAHEIMRANGASSRWRKGTNEVSTPNNRRSNSGFNDSTWLIGAVPFHYGDGHAHQKFWGTNQPRAASQQDEGTPHDQPNPNGATAPAGFLRQQLAFAIRACLRSSSARFQNPGHELGLPALAQSRPARLKSSEVNHGTALPA